jgi:hypothetical protein
MRDFRRLTLKDAVFQPWQAGIFRTRLTLIRLAENPALGHVGASSGT